MKHLPKEDPRDLVQDRKQDGYHLDGNALGGLLADVFGRDITGGNAACAACGAHNATGALIAFNRPPDSVLSCPGCGAVLFVVVHRPGVFRVTFGSLLSLDILSGK